MSLNQSFLKVLFQCNSLSPSSPRSVGQYKDPGPGLDSKNRDFPVPWPTRGHQGKHPAQPLWEKLFAKGQVDPTHANASRLSDAPGSPGLPEVSAIVQSDSGPLPPGS